jgi:DNA-binding response OmpR family regulator
VATPPKIVLIDDDKDVLALNTLVLHQAGYEVLFALDGDEGLRLIREEKPDVIICDVMMSPMNGYAVLKAVNEYESLTDIPFLFLTSRSGGADERFAMTGLGADGYIVKPCPRKELLKLVARAIENRPTRKSRFQPKK